MKKLTALLLAAFFAMSLASCGGDDKPEKPGTTGAQTTAGTEKPAAQTTAAPEDNKGDIDGALALLTKVWGSYKEDDKFPAAGGDMSEENMTMGDPGKFGLDDADALDTTLGFPKASADKIDDAASLVHMMNANTFTCGAFHLKDAGDFADVFAAIKDNIMQRQWMCGFPDKLVIVKIDDYIVSFFGENDTVDTFKANLTAAFSSAETVCDEPIA